MADSRKLAYLYAGPIGIEFAARITSVPVEKWTKRKVRPQFPKGIRIKRPEKSLF